jgi:hypothetical protein
MAKTSTYLVNFRYFVLADQPLAKQKYRSAKVLFYITLSDKYNGRFTPFENE